MAEDDHSNGKAHDTPKLPRFFFKEWRVAAGLSQQDLANVLDLSKNTINRIELSQRGFTIDFLIDFQIAVGCPGIGDPLNRKPDTPIDKPLTRAKRVKRQVPAFTSAKALRKRLRDTKKPKPK